MKLIMFFCLMSSFAYADHFDDLLVQFEKEYSHSKLDIYPSIDKYYDLVYAQKESEFNKRIILIKTKQREKMLKELTRQMSLEKILRTKGNG